MHVEAVGESDRRAVADVGGDVVLVDVGLQFVRGRHHHQVGPCGSFGHGHHLEAIGLGLLGRGRTFAQGDNDFLQRRILQVQRMGTALRAIADDGTFLDLMRLRSASRS
jgi:hypothetical protein